MLEIINSKNRVQLGALLKRLENRSVSLDAELMNLVTAIVDDVRRRGDAALVDYAAKYDGLVIESSDLRIDPEVLARCAESADARTLAALRESIRRVREFHEHQREESWEVKSKDGVRLGQRIVPIESAGLYVPGGTASYPSSVVMNAVPAQVAGVERLVVATPPRTLSDNPAVAAALVELGVTEVYAVGGAQAIAALAYGTETVPRVDKITGPGNKYVAAAKKIVFGAVGIDSIAGPSEVVIIADKTARPDYIAADLLAQAEHGEDASSILMTTSQKLAQSVAAEVVRQTETLPRRAIVERSLASYGAIIVVQQVEEACALVNEMAPEHLEIMTSDEEYVANLIRHAGAIFLGCYTPESVGDYFAGPNHVLPTGRAARYSSALGVYDFVKRISVLKYSAGEINETANMIATLAHAEGLEAHARSVLMRLDTTEAA